MEEEEYFFWKMEFFLRIGAEMFNLISDTRSLGDIGNRLPKEGCEGCKLQHLELAHNPIAIYSF
jgi:hypothetical protein